MLTMLSKEVGRALRGYCPQSIREGLVSRCPVLVPRRRQRMLSGRRRWPVAVSTCIVYNRVETPVAFDPRWVERVLSLEKTRKRVRAVDASKADAYYARGHEALVASRRGVAPSAPTIPTAAI